jgi:hypothetical protein
MHIAISWSFQWLHSPLNDSVHSMARGLLGAPDAETDTTGIWIANIPDDLFDGSDHELDHVGHMLTRAFSQLGKVVGKPYVRKKMGDTTSARQEHQSWALMKIIPSCCEDDLLNGVDIHGQRVIVRKQKKRQTPQVGQKRSAQAATLPYCIAFAIGLVSFLVIFTFSSGLHSAQTAEWLLDFVLSLLLKWMLYEPLSKRQKHLPYLTIEYMFTALSVSQESLHCLG